MTPPLDPRFVFDRFVVGPGNRLAAAAARRAAEAPGRNYNPLVIAAAPGLGKTHLLMAVGERARSLEPGLRVHYETIDSFVDRLTTSIAAGTLDEFRAANAQMDLLLLDDLQQVAGKARTQEELLRAWEELIQRGAQVVVSTDRALHEIPALDGRLGSRLAGGLIVEVNPPDAATRSAILREMVRERGFVLRDAVVDAIAALPIESIRELQGALNRVVAAGEIDEREVEAADVPAVLGMKPPDGGAPTDEFGAFLSDISTAVAAVVEMSPWKRRVAKAILRWEGEGVRTRRLEEALDADSAPDVEGLLSAFARDVSRMREIAAELSGISGYDAALLRDPDRLEEAERLLLETRAAALGGAAAPTPRAEARSQGVDTPTPRVDLWFLDREKLAWNWLALEERIVEEQR